MLAHAAAREVTPLRSRTPLERHTAVPCYSNPHATTGPAQPSPLQNLRVALIIGVQGNRGPEVANAARGILGWIADVGDGAAMWSRRQFAWLAHGVISAAADCLLPAAPDLDRLAATGHRCSGLRAPRRHAVGTSG